jgi:hypothetical protein
MAIKIQKGRLVDPAMRSKSLCFIDGDSQHKEEPSNGIYKLPGSQPERTVFDGVLKAMSTNFVPLTVAVQLESTEQERVRKVIMDIDLKNVDPHLLFSQVKSLLGIDEAVVRGAFLSQWVRNNRPAVDHLVSAIRKNLEEAGSDDSKWVYTLDNKKRHGPFLMIELQKLLKRGQIAKTTMVCKDATGGTQKWIPLEECLAAHRS